MSKNLNYIQLCEQAYFIFGLNWTFTFKSVHFMFIYVSEYKEIFIEYLLASKWFHKTLLHVIKIFTKLFNLANNLKNHIIFYV